MHPRDDMRTDWRRLALCAVYAGLLTIALGLLGHDPPLAKGGIALLVLGVGRLLWGLRG